MAGIRKIALAKVALNRQNYLFQQTYFARMGLGKSSEGEKSGRVPSAIEYDVFLNFRGPDTRQGFADCLYHIMLNADIRVFFDEKELHVSKKIGDGLRIAIERSKIYVPIFSKGYASDPRCLRELEHMVECRKFKPSEKEILPIFYDVEPHDVGLQSQLYTSALAKHEEKIGCQATRSWKDALKVVAQIEGWELKNQGYGWCAEPLQKNLFWIFITRTLKSLFVNKIKHIMHPKRSKQNSISLIDLKLSTCVLLNDGLHL